MRDLEVTELLKQKLLSSFNRFPEQTSDVELGALMIRIFQLSTDQRNEMVRHVWSFGERERVVPFLRRLNL